MCYIIQEKKRSVTACDIFMQESFEQEIWQEGTEGRGDKRGKKGAGEEDYVPWRCEQISWHQMSEYCVVWWSLDVTDTAAVQFLNTEDGQLWVC